MRAVLRFLGSRWFLSFIGVVLLGVLVWLFGPFLSFLEDWIPRAIVIVVMLLIWAGVNFWLDRRRRKNENTLVEGVGGRSRGDARQTDHGPGPAEEGVRRARLSV
jgi:type VI secretion system protein ImpL